MLVALRDLLFSSYPGSKRPRQIHGHNQVDGIGLQVYGPQDVDGDLAGKQSLERCRDQLLDRGCSDTMQFATALAAELDGG